MSCTIYRVCIPAPRAVLGGSLPYFGPSRMVWVEQETHVEAKSTLASRRALAKVQKICQFWLFTLWLVTFWLLTVYFSVFLKLFSGFVHFLVDFTVSWSLKPALRASRGSSRSIASSWKAKRSRTSALPAFSRSENVLHFEATDSTSRKTISPSRRFTARGIDSSSLRLQVRKCALTSGNRYSICITRTFSTYSIGFCIVLHTFSACS